MAFEYLAEYATFHSVEDMDLNVKQHIDKCRLDLTASERAIVFALAARSLMHIGASHLKAETIALAVKISTKTVYRSIKKLVDLSIIEKVPQPKLNGIKGASIYKILPFADNVPTEVSQRMTVDEASNDEDSNDVSENLSIKSFNLLSSKQAKNNLYDLQNELALQAERKRVYMNEWQQMLYDFLHSYPMHDSLKDELYKLVLATEINDAQAFHKAKNVFLNILMDIHNGTLTVSSTLRAVYVGAYKQACKYEVVPTAATVEDTVERKIVPLYNWLDEREDYVTPNINKPALENWVDW